MSLSNPHHLLGLVAIFILCCIGYRIFVVKAHKIKLKINVDSSLATSYGLGDLSAGKNVRFELVGRCLTHKVNPDWYRAIVSGIRTRNLPLSFEIAGRQITCVIDARNYFVTGDIGARRGKWLETQSTSGPNIALGQFHIKIERFPRPVNLKDPNLPCKDYPANCGQGTNRNPEDAPSRKF